MSALGDFLTYVAKERAVIRGAPVAFVGAVLATSVIIWGAMEWRYGGIIEQLNFEKGRLRIALGIDPATPNALISLNNKELAAKATTVVARLRDFAKEYNDGVEGIRKQTNLTGEQKFEMQKAMASNIDVEFTKAVKSDAFNVDFELRRRLGPKVVAGIIGISPSVVDGDGTRMDILQLTSVGGPIVELGTLNTLAFGIEQMAKLLPDKG